MPRRHLRNQQDLTYDRVECAKNRELSFDSREGPLLMKAVLDN